VRWRRDRGSFRLSGYENSPDYGGPDPFWREAAVILAAIITLAGAIWALRPLLLHWGVAWCPAVDRGLTEPSACFA
jgi:hypothetical protein